MANKETLPNVTRMRERFTERAFVRQKELRQNAIVTARKMVIAMSVDSNFTIEDFLFAATMGEPEKYPNEEYTLGIMSQIKPGDLVGVYSDIWLNAIGIASSTPFTMEVEASQFDADNAPQYNRRLNAYLNLGIAARRAAEDARHPRLDLELCPGGLDVKILQAGGEPEWYTENVFYKSLNVVVGTYAILDRLDDDDKIGRLQIAECMNYIGGLALNSLSVTEQ